MIINQEIVDKLISEFSKDKKKLPNPVVKFIDNNNKYIASPHRVIQFANDEVKLDLPEKNIIRAIEMCKGNVVTIEVNVKQWVDSFKNVNVKSVGRVDIYKSDVGKISVLSQFKDEQKPTQEMIINYNGANEDFNVSVSPKYLKHALDLFRKLKVENINIKFNMGKYPILILSSDKVKYLIMGIVYK